MTTLARWISSATIYPMSYANAVFTKLSSTEGLIEVTYSNGFTSFERIIVRRGFSVYDAAYAAASRKASYQGDTLGRFARAA